MNWYHQEILYKEAINWGDFAKGISPFVLSGLLFLGISQNDIKNQSPSQIKQTVMNKAQEKGIEESQIRSIIEELDQAILSPQNTQQPEAQQTQPKKQTSFAPFIPALTQREGFRTKVYDDGAGYATIGIGHMMGKILAKDKNGIPTKIIPNERSVKVFNELFGNTLDFNLVATGKQVLTKEQAQRLAEAVDVPEHYARARNLFPNIDNYPDYVKYALLNGVFRGEFKKDYQVTKAINEGNFKDVTRFYLMRKDYSQAQKNGRLRGIIARMDENQYAFLKYALELGQITQQEYQQKMRLLDLTDLTFME